MPFYRYNVTDATGEVREGSLQAATSDAARTALVKAGMQVRQISAANGPVGVPLAPPVPTIQRTAAVGDKARFILFSQLGRFARAGVAPNQAFGQIAAQATKKPLREALLAAEAAATSGASVSDVFGRYPDVFPPDVVATYRAGELGGFLADACDEISNQAHLSHQLKRKTTMFGITLAVVAGSFPFALAVIQGALASIDVQDRAGGSLPPVATLMASVQKTAFAMAPIAIAAYVVAYLAWRVWHSLPARPLRHRIVLIVPILAGRARAESLARFGWVMSMLARGGAPPNVCLQVAAASMPNLELARRMLATASTMKENERLSSALRRSDLLSVEYQNVVENGELTGDVPGAVMNMARATNADFEARDKSFSHLSGMLFYIPFGLLTLFIAVFLLKTFYGGLMSHFQAD